MKKVQPRFEDHIGLGEKPKYKSFLLRMHQESTNNEVEEPPIDPECFPQNPSLPHPKKRMQLFFKEEEDKLCVDSDVFPNDSCENRTTQFPVDSSQAPQLACPKKPFLKFPVDSRSLMKPNEPLDTRFSFNHPNHRESLSQSFDSFNDSYLLEKFDTRCPNDILFTDPLNSPLYSSGQTSLGKFLDPDQFQFLRTGLSPPTEEDCRAGCPRRKSPRKSRDSVDLHPYSFSTADPNSPCCNSMSSVPDSRIPVSWNPSGNPSFRNSLTQEEQLRGINVNQERLNLLTLDLDPSHDPLLSFAAPPSPYNEGTSNREFSSRHLPQSHGFSRSVDRLRLSSQSSHSSKFSNSAEDLRLPNSSRLAQIISEVSGKQDPLRQLVPNTSRLKLSAEAASRRE